MEKWREYVFRRDSGRFRVGVIMCVEPLFPTELNIASVIRWPVHTCLVKQSDHIWSLFPAGRGIFCNMIYFRANESQRFTRGLDHKSEQVNDQTRSINLATNSYRIEADSDWKLSKDRFSLAVGKVIDRILGFLGTWSKIDLLFSIGARWESEEDRRKGFEKSNSHHPSSILLRENILITEEQKLRREKFTSKIQGTNCRTTSFILLQEIFIKNPDCEQRRATSFS